MGGAEAKPSRACAICTAIWLAAAAGCHTTAELARLELLGATPAAQMER
jgi:hypothetical protein